MPAQEGRSDQKPSAPRRPGEAGHDQHPSVSLTNSPKYDLEIAREHRRLPVVIVIAIGLSRSASSLLTSRGAISAAVEIDGLEHHYDSFVTARRPASSVGRLYRALQTGCQKAISRKIATMPLNGMDQVDL